MAVRIDCRSGIEVRGRGPIGLANIYVRLQSHRLALAAFDEQKAADALGWSGELLLGLTSATLLVVVIWLIIKLPHRWLSVPAVMLGNSHGMGALDGIIGSCTIP
jgi:hypothetical protein